jgi:hypothetical protein
MKKVIALFAVMMLIPMTAFGMQSMDQQEMSEVTGQSGVAITIDDVVLHQSASETWYQNTMYNSTGGVVSQGSVGMVESGEQLTMVNAIVGWDDTNDEFQSAGDYGLQGDYTFNGIDSTVYDPSSDFSPSPLTIQVGQFGPLASLEGTTSAFAAAGHTQATGVVVGLPTVEIHQEGATAMELLVSNSANPIGDTRDPANGVSSFGTLYTGDSTMAVLDGRIEITPVEELEYR